MRMTQGIVRTSPLREFLDSRMARYSSVAERLGVSTSHLSRVMDGERPLTPDLAERLATLFGVPASTFLPESEAE